MKRIAAFEKVGEELFVPAYQKAFGGSTAQAKQAYQALKLPRRATFGSAGYDFFTPGPVELSPGETISIPTGIRVKMDWGWVLQIYPRSGLGFRYRLQLDNTVGVIDSDYYYSDNQGHIFIKITNDSKSGKTLSLQPGDGFAQGIFLEYGITWDDEVNQVRNGGFGSTSKGDGSRDS